MGTRHRGPTIIKSAFFLLVGKCLFIFYSLNVPDGLAFTYSLGVGIVSLGCEVSGVGGGEVVLRLHERGHTPRCDIYGAPSVCKGMYLSVAPVFWYLSLVTTL